MFYGTFSYGNVLMLLFIRLTGAAMADDDGGWRCLRAAAAARLGRGRRSSRESASELVGMDGTDDNGVSTWRRQRIFVGLELVPRRGVRSLDKP